MGHTVRYGKGVFDRLQEVKVGQEVLVKTKRGTLRYEVTKTKRYPKHEVYKDDEPWEQSSGTLVLVSCFLNTDESPQDHNFVVYAQLVGAEEK